MRSLKAWFRASIMGVSAVGGGGGHPRRRTRPLAVSSRSTVRGTISSHSSRLGASLVLTLPPGLLVACGDSSAVGGGPPSSGGSGPGGGEETTSTSSSGGVPATGGSSQQGGDGEGGGTPASFEVTVVVSGEGGGHVTSDPPGIDCGVQSGTCSASFASGQAVILTPAQLPSARLRWSAGPCAGEVGTCTFDVDAAISVAGAYVATTTLDFSVDGDAGLSVAGQPCAAPCSTVVDVGASIDFEVTATADGNYRVASVDHGSCSGDSLAQSCTMTLTGPTTVNVATLPHLTAAPSPLLAAAIAGNGINCGAGNPMCDLYAPKGTVVDLSYALATGYQIMDWTGACAGTSIDPSHPHCSFALNAPSVAGADFVQATAWSFEAGYELGSEPVHGTLTDSTVGPPALAVPQFIEMDCVGGPSCQSQQILPPGQRWLHWVTSDPQVDVQWYGCIQQVDVHPWPSDPCEVESWCLRDFTDTSNPNVLISEIDHSGSFGPCMF